MKNKKESFGKITIGVGTTLRRELNIIDYVQCKFKDNRVCTISKIEDGSYSLTIENPESSGRNPQSSIWLSKDSYLSLIAASFIYWGCKGEDAETLIKQVMEGNKVEYNFSNNLKDFKIEKK